MSDDIVTRLRIWSDNAKEQDATDIVVGLCAAADEIERLRARWRDGDGLVSRLRELERDLLNEGEDLSNAYYIPTIGEAADEIERLRERLSRMEAKR